MILGTKFIIMKFVWIETSHRQIIHRSGQAAAIVKRFENEDPAQLALNPV